jgi:hypothetical protein
MHGLAALTAIAALALTGCAAAAAATSTAGTTAVTVKGGALLKVQGTFEMTGGPIWPGQSGPSVRPLAGTVTFRDGQGHTVGVKVGPSGKFTVNLRAGQYTAIAETRQIEQQNPDGSYSSTPIVRPVTVTARAGQPARVSIVCYVP